MEQGYYQGLIHQGETADNKSLNSLEITSGNRVRWLIRNQTNNVIDLFSNSLLEANQWHHIA